MGADNFSYGRVANDMGDVEGSLPLLVTDQMVRSAEEKHSGTLGSINW